LRRSQQAVVGPARKLYAGGKLALTGGVGAVVLEHGLNQELRCKRMLLDFDPMDFRNQITGGALLQLVRRFPRVTAEIF
jgi:hypothetical protein